MNLRYKIANLMKLQTNGHCSFIHKHVGEWHSFWVAEHLREWAILTAGAAAAGAGGAIN